mmetsp:Transcript_20675/g.31567  ORF Transcript_20675/g.31567 Transcript_20675/m.31567 type:complete len:211 (-) Transcript_20675:1148-1780(-)
MVKYPAPKARETISLRVHNLQPTLAPITVKLPDNITLTSTRTGTHNIPGLPPEACKTDILPGLTKSLISVSKLTDNGCNNVTFDKTKSSPPEIPSHSPSANVLPMVCGQQSQLKSMLSLEKQQPKTSSNSFTQHSSAQQNQHSSKPFITTTSSGPLDSQAKTSINFSRPPKQPSLDTLTNNDKTYNQHRGTTIKRPDNPLDTLDDPKKTS